MQRTHQSAVAHHLLAKGSFAMQQATVLRPARATHAAGRSSSTAGCSIRSASRALKAQHRRPPTAAGAPAAAPRRLAVVACHRCVQRQLVGRPQPCARSVSFAAAVKRGSRLDVDSRQQADPQSAAHSAAEPGSGGNGGGGPERAPGSQQQQQQQPPPLAEAQEQEDSAGVKAALAALKFYKSAISPLMQPVCRYQPTCSVYSMDAFKKFGVGKGFLLTAWRLLRCSPFGSSGYDPVRWPPPGLERLFPQAGSEDGGGSDSSSGGSSKM